MFPPKVVWSSTECGLFDFWPWKVTLTLIPAGCNLPSAHCLNIVHICGELLKNLQKGSKYKADKKYSAITFDL